MPPVLFSGVGFGRVATPNLSSGIYGGGGFGGGHTWHLSVIDAGMPRNPASASTGDPALWMMASYLEATNWEASSLLGGQWLVASTMPAEEANFDTQRFVFGAEGAIPVVGDFNGDGISELGLYLEGEWFLDLNGNGHWDRDDLWARLGSAADRPVVGDWDGDGKDDIGIFGPQWTGDPKAIRAEPGLPDVFNRSKNKPKNVPPSATEATNGHRLLKLQQQGPGRADLIDHVFRFGSGRQTPVAGDWNGDGIRTIGVFREGRWRMDLDGDGRWTRADGVAMFGADGDIPIVGDFNGDGVEQIGVYRGGTWYVDSNGNLELDAHDRVFALGDIGDQPVVGDFDGDGVDDPGVYRDQAPPEVPTSN
jgi:hypothetical protein